MKKVKVRRRRNVVARALRTPLYRMRVVRNKKNYTRKPKHRHNLTGKDCGIFFAK